MTQGRAVYVMEFDHYEEVPKNIQDEIVGTSQKTKGVKETE
jgi:elongation factor G